eukprot:865352-Ditylum_brightwellii.AAC.1
MVMQTRIGSLAPHQTQQESFNCSSYQSYSGVRQRVPPLGNKDLHVVSLPSVVLVSYEHGLMAGSINMYQLELMEDYHTVVVLWNTTIQYQLSSQTGLSGLTFSKNNKP